MQTIYTVCEGTMSCILGKQVTLILFSVCFACHVIFFLFEVFSCTQGLLSCMFIYILSNSRSNYCVVYGMHSTVL